MAFLALQAAVDLVRVLQPVIRKIARVDPSLADQIRRAAQSNVLNLSEGAERIGRDQTQFFRRALGSVTETRDGLYLALVSAYVEPADLAEVWLRVSRSRGFDWRLVHPKAKAKPA